MPITRQKDAEVSISYPHYKVHDGHAYVCSFINTATANNGVVEMVIDVGSNGAHGVFEINTVGEAYVYLLANATATSNGTTLTAYNLNSESTNSTTVSFYKLPTALTGTSVFNMYVPGGGKKSIVGGIARRGAEHIFENLKGAIRVVNTSGTVGAVNIIAEYYEVQE